MVIYKGDFLLSQDDRFDINEMNSSSKRKNFNIDRDVYIEGLGEVLVRIEVDVSKGVKIELNSLKIDNSNRIYIEKEDLYEIISVYKFRIIVNKKEAQLLLNVRLDKNDFIETNDCFLENLNILKYKVESNLKDDLVLYMENLDLNYILNIIYGAFVIHTYDIIYPNNKYTRVFKVIFTEKLEKIGVIIPKPNADILKKVELIVDLIENEQEIKPKDMYFALINTLPGDLLSAPYKISDSEVLCSSIYALISNNKGIDCL